MRFGSDGRGPSPLHQVRGIGSKGSDIGRPELSFPTILQMGAFEASPIDDAVAAYVRRCRDHLGGGEALATAISRLLGRVYDPKTIFSWGAREQRSRHRVPGVALFAMHRVTGLSLDAAATGQETALDLLRRYSERLEQLESQSVRDLSRELEELREGEGRRELASPEEEPSNSRGT